MNRRNVIVVFILTILVIFGTLSYFGVIKLPFFNNTKQDVVYEKPVARISVPEMEELEIAVPEEPEPEPEREEEVEAYTPY